VQETGALDRARLLAREFADRAKASLNGGANTEYGRALMSVPDFILARDS
jgi:geranylgeranyl pyrophosphate synthase